MKKRIIKIMGIITMLSFIGCGDNEKLLEVSNGGNVEVDKEYNEGFTALINAWLIQ